MPFEASLVGHETGPLRWEASTRRILAFAAALAPDDGRLLDDLAEGGLTALPMIVVSAEWALALDLRAAAGSSLTAAEARRGVHVEQDSRFIA
ncbi:MAG: hypothetical protein ACREEB_13470, partial [Caulobacteraceae bacterium]